MLKTVQERFLQDPQWHLVEDIIKEYVDPLRDILTVDVSKDAEDVKAQVIGRQKAYENLTKFLEDAKIVSKPALIDKKNIFR